MEMNKKLAAGAVALLVIAFAFGRYSAPAKVKIETVTKTVEVEKKTHDETTRVDQDRSKRTERETVELVRPDGSKETRTKVVETSETSRDRTTTVSDREKTTKTRDEETRKEVSKTTGTLNLSLLGGAKIGEWDVGPKYGAQISRNILGPITMGVWGFNDKTCGLSLGLNF